MLPPARYAAAPDTLRRLTRKTWLLRAAALLAGILALALLLVARHETKARHSEAAARWSDRRDRCATVALVLGVASLAARDRLTWRKLGL